MSETEDRAKRHAKIGEIYYHTVVDSHGYPNGMPYWPEMSPAEKYYETVTGLTFLENLAREGIINMPDGFGLRDPRNYGEGDCKALMDYFTNNHDAWLKDFQERVEKMRSLYKENKER